MKLRLYCSALYVQLARQGKHRGNDVLLTSEAVAEVQMKLHSHLQLLWKFKRHCWWQFKCQLQANGGQRHSRRTWKHPEVIWRPPGEHLQCTLRPLGALGAHLEPTWSLLGGHLETTWSPSWPKTRPRDAQELPKGTKERPKSLPRATKSALRAAKTGRRATRSAPRDSQERPS